MVRLTGHQPNPILPANRGGTQPACMVRQFVPNCTNFMAKDQDPSWAGYASIGLQIAVGVGLGALIGSWLDNKFNWTPWGVITGSMLGLASGLYLLIKEAMKLNKD